MEARKAKILEVIIQNYLETGEPVGSRTISKTPDLNLSSATIRNEMADLEELGYILQPHTSAGRIPSDMGYRFYVDKLMHEKEEQIKKTEEEKNEHAFMLQRVDKIEALLQNVASLLAFNTNYTTVVSTPQYQKTKLKFIQLSQVNESQLLAVIVIDGNIVKNQMIEVEEALCNEDILKLNVMLNTYMQGLSLQEINLDMIMRMREQAGMHEDVLNEILEAVGKHIQSTEGLEVYTSGATNILKYPELSGAEKATDLLVALEEKRVLTDLLTNTINSEEGEGVQIYIGDESKVEHMKDCSIVTTTYEMEEGLKGTIGIIGPKRMDYDKVVDSINGLKKQLEKLFRDEKPK